MRNPLSLSIALVRVGVVPTSERGVRLRCWVLLLIELVEGVVGCLRGCGL